MDRPLNRQTYRTAMVRGGCRIRFPLRREVIHRQVAERFAPALGRGPARGRARYLLASRAGAFASEGAAIPRGWPSLAYPRPPTELAAVYGFLRRVRDDRRRGASRHIRRTSGILRNAGRAPDTCFGCGRCRKLFRAALLHIDSRRHILRSDRVLG